jgi:hypothetical protein
VPLSFPWQETTKENTLSGGFSQRVTVQVGIYLAVTNKSDVLGFAAHEELEVVRAGSQSCLVRLATQRCGFTCGLCGRTIDWL